MELVSWLDRHGGRGGRGDLESEEENCSSLTKQERDEMIASYKVLTIIYS